jgi:hypothetical protein
VDGTRSALIVASSEYTDPGLRRLRAPASDAQALAAVLRDPGIGGFEVRTLLNDAAYDVNLAVEEFFADRRPDDLLLVHFSCHGVKDQDGELYFAAANTVLRALGATAVAAEFVNRRMSRSRSRRIVLLLDCCYAGAFERGMTARAGSGVGIESQFGGRGRAVITASSAMEYAFEGGELADTQELQPSVFTSALVQGLATGEADRDQDGMVALDELYDYVYDKVRAATPNQTPGKWTFGVQGDLYIARRARPVTTPAPLPPQLQEAIGSPFAAIRAAAVQELVRLLQGRHAGQALAARLALQRLTEDDSRTVVAAATEALNTQTAPAPPTPTPPTLALSATVVDFGRVPQHGGRPPEQRVRLGNAGGGNLNARAETSASWLKLRQVGDDLLVGVDTTAVGEHEGTVIVDSDGGSATIAVQAQIDPQPLTTPEAVATTHPDAPTERPDDAGPGVRQDAVFPTGAPAPGVTAAPVSEPIRTEMAASGGGAAVTGAERAFTPAGVEHPALPRTPADPRLLMAGQLAIVGVAALILGLFRAYIYTDSLWQGRSGLAHMRWYALYLVAIATLTLVVGACTLIPFTRRLIGPGLLLGVVAASTWSLLFLVSDRLRYKDILGGGWWIELVAHLALVLAACLAGLVLARTGAVRLMRRPPRRELAWLIVLLGCVGALALIFHDWYLWYPWWHPDRWYVVPSIWMTVMAAAVPACAALAVPRRLGVALLAGWIAGAAVFFGFQYVWDSRQYGAPIGSSPIITFGFTLLALLVVTVLFTRAAPSSDVEPTTRG